MPTNADPTHARIPQSGLINEEALWATIRRLFDCRPATVLGELIQNAARSASGLEDARRRLTIELDEERGQAVFADRGCGLDGIAGLRTLLTLGKSVYADPTVALHQHPMGLGLYSLVAHHQVREVTSRSIPPAGGPTAPIA